MIRNRTAIVVLLTGLNFVNYLDRIIVAAVLVKIQADLRLSDFEGGLLATVFLLGYFVTSPIFGSLGDRMPRKYLIAAGVFVWSAATIASGLTGSLAGLIAARAVVGVGEASYATLAPTIIDDITPADQKGKYLAIFYLAVPVGSALGYLVGGFVEAHWSWRAAFFVGGVPGIVLSVLCLAIAEPERKLAETKASVVASAKSLAQIPLYRRSVLGYVAHTAAIGAFAFWGPTFLVTHFGVKNETGTFWFGTTTVIAGIIGTIIGGRLADRAVGQLPPSDPADGHMGRANRLVANAQLRICAIGVAIAFPLAALAFVMPNATAFFICAGLCEVGLFMSTSPISAVMLRTVPPHLRASSMALGIFAIHLFGDLWSPPAVGLLRDQLVDQVAMMALPIGFLIATLVWWPRPDEAR